MHQIKSEDRQAICAKSFSIDVLTSSLPETSASSDGKSLPKHPVLNGYRGQLGSALASPPVTYVLVHLTKPPAKRRFTRQASTALWSISCSRFFFLTEWRPACPRFRTLANSEKSYRDSRWCTNCAQNRIPSTTYSVRAFCCFALREGKKKKKSHLVLRMPCLGWTEVSWQDVVRHGVRLIAKVAHYLSSVLVYDPEDGFRVHHVLWQKWTKKRRKNKTRTTNMSSSLTTMKQDCRHRHATVRPKRLNHVVV